MNILMQCINVHTGVGQLDHAWTVLHLYKRDLLALQRALMCCNWLEAIGLIFLIEPFVPA